MGSKPPKKTAEEKALAAAQARELDRQGEDLMEKKRRILRAQVGGRGSMLSGNERGVRPGENRSVGGASSTPLSTLGAQTRAGQFWGNVRRLVRGPGKTSASGGGGGGGGSGGRFRRGSGFNQP